MTRKEESIKAGDRVGRFEVVRVVIGKAGVLNYVCVCSECDGKRLFKDARILKTQSKKCNCKTSATSIYDPSQVEEDYLDYILRSARRSVLRREDQIKKEKKQDKKGKLKAKPTAETEGAIRRAEKRKKREKELEDLSKIIARAAIAARSRVK